jgi:hypothetical protein
VDVLLGAAGVEVAVVEEEFEPVDGVTGVVLVDELVPVPDGEVVVDVVGAGGTLGVDVVPVLEGDGELVVEPLGVETGAVLPEGFVTMLLVDTILDVTSNASTVIQSPCELAFLRPVGPMATVCGPEVSPETV